MILPELARAEAWHRWRSQIDLDALSYEDQQTLPALAASLPRWLEGDPLAARIQGIVKMAWSRNQILLHAAAELHRVLEVSISPVAIVGPLAWSLLGREDGAIRTIPDLGLLIPRHLVLHAVSTLALHGWQLRSPEPDTDTLDWSSNLAFTKGDRTFHLYWRLTPRLTPEAFDFEQAILAGLRATRWRQHEFFVLSPEADLLHRLIDRPSWDPVPWQADVLMMSFAGIDWPRWRELAVQFSACFEPVDPLQRLMELRRDWQLPMPSIPPPKASDAARTRFKSLQLRSKLSRWGSLLWKA